MVKPKPRSGVFTLVSRVWNVIAWTLGRMVNALSKSIKHW